MASGTRASLLALGAALALVLGLAACGGDDPAELATLAPAHSIAYAEAVVKPEGARRDTVEAILERFPGGEEAGERLIEALDATLGEEELSFRDDVEPWLGERVAGALITLGARPDFAVLLESTDDGAARDLIAGAVEREEDVTEREHEGVSYLSDGDMAAAVLEGALVIASDPGIADVIDAANGEEALIDDDAFADAFEIDDETFGFAWVNPEGVMDLLAAGLAIQDSGIDPVEAKELLEGLGLSGEEPFVARLTASEDSVALELESEAAVEGPPSGLLPEMPEDSLLALGLGEGLLAFQAEAFLSGFELGATKEGADPEELFEALRAELGFDPMEALEGLGSGGAFLRGRGITDIGAGLAFEVSDRDAVESALVALREQVEATGAQAGALAPGLPDDPAGFSILPADAPFPVTVALTDERLAIAFGPAAAERLLEPEETLEGSDRLADARDALDGLEPTLMIDVTRIVGFAETFGLGADLGFQEASDYLDALREILAGSEVSDGRDRARIAVSFSA